LGTDTTPLIGEIDSDGDLKPSGFSDGSDNLLTSPAGTLVNGPEGVGGEAISIYPGTNGDVLISCLARRQTGTDTFSYTPIVEELTGT
jgi:hypothetical protein